MDITVTTADGTSATSASDQFTYAALYLTADKTAITSGQSVTFTTNAPYNYLVAFFNNDNQRIGTYGLVMQLSPIAWTRFGTYYDKDVTCKIFNVSDIDTNADNTILYSEESNFYSAAPLVSKTVTFSANPAPTILTHPSGATKYLGDPSPTLSVSATGSGTLSYQWYKSQLDTNSNFTAISDAVYATCSAPTSSAGTTYYYCIITNTDNSVNGTNTATTTSSAVSVIVNNAVPSNNYEEVTPTPTPTPKDKGVEVVINGKAENLGTEVTKTVNGSTTTTIVMDDKKLDEKLNNEGNHSIVSIPVKSQTDVVIGELTGQLVKSMENKEAVLEIKTENVSYTLPASQINIDAVSEAIGKSVELKDIKVQIKIAKSTEETVKIIEDSARAGNFTVVAQPIDFTITCSDGNMTVDVSKFNSYVERMVAIPDGVDPNKITTGIVFNPDGTFYHVPTAITVINGKYYAKINSLTNSTYSVIWHPL